jgi:hypothetical protein
MRALSALVLLVVASTGQAQPPGKNPLGQGSPPEKVRWEYAELFVRTIPAFQKDGDERPKAPTTTVKWTTDKEEATFTSYADFAGKVKMDGFKVDASPSHQRVQILNHLGHEGWELVESGSMTSGVASRTMLFKRRVR